MAIAGHIKNATELDMRKIYLWLKSDKEQCGEAGFLNNWNLTQKRFTGGDVLVFIEEESNDPIAYQWGKLVEPGILNVKLNKRGNGVGRAIVDYCTELAKKNDQCVLYIECRPDSSKPFWKKMGFTLFENSESWDIKNHAYKVLPKHFGFPEDVDPNLKVNIEVKFFPKSVNWKPTTQPYEIFNLQGLREKGSKTVFLEDRVGFVPPDGDSDDCIAEFIINGKTVFKKKPRYWQSQSIGFFAEGPGFYIDKINTVSGTENNVPPGI